MKSKILLISLAVVLALSLGLVGCTEDGGGIQPSEKIVIGSSRSITGALSAIHVGAFGAVGPAYVGAVNSRAPTAGIEVDGTYFLMDYKFLNDGSNEGTLSSHINTLINDVEAGDVHTIFGPTSTHFIDVVAPITNEAGVVLITVEGGATFLRTGAGYLDSWPYVFISLSFSDWYQQPVMATVIDENEADADVYTCWQRDAHGQEYMAGAWGDPVKGITGAFPLVGLQSVGNSSVLATDPAGWATTLLNGIGVGTEPNVMCLFCYPDEIWAILGAADSLGFEPDMWVIGPGANFGFFGTAGCPATMPPSFGADAEGMMCFAVANNETSPAMADLFNVKLAPPVPFPVLCIQDFWGHPLYWAALEMWELAVKEVGTTALMADEVTTGFLIDQDDLKDELAGYTSGDPVTTVLGSTWFEMVWAPDPDGPGPGVSTMGGGLIDYKCHTGEIGQWQNGYIEIIAPTNVLDMSDNSTVAIGTLLTNYTNTTDTITWPWGGW